MEKIKAYKVTDKNMQCLGFQFELGKTFKHQGNISICKSGFHACLKVADCFSYYSFSPENRIFEVECSGQIETKGNDSKICCSEIIFIKELTRTKMLVIANEGANNTGLRNTGNCNTGNSNTGDWNTGYKNTGDRNTGDRNTGDCNTGYRNTGYRNTGDWNTGDSNTGDSNTGDCNTGDWNTGYRNTGNRNTGYWNTGDRNTGDSNTGDCNTGYWNAGNRNTGAFCTKEPAFSLFNKPCKMSHDDFVRSRAYYILNRVDTKLWVQDNVMTDEEKKNNPSYKTCGGYLKDIPLKEATQNMWHNLSDSDKKCIMDLENFDAEIFFEITGIKI